MCSTTLLCTLTKLINFNAFILNLLILTLKEGILELKMEIYILILVVGIAIGGFACSHISPNKHTKNYNVWNSDGLQMV